MVSVIYTGNAKVHFGNSAPQDKEAIERLLKDRSAWKSHKYERAYPRPGYVAGVDLELVVTDDGTRILFEQKGSEIIVHDISRSSEADQRAVSAAHMRLRLLEIAKECVDKGPGYAQESVVLHEAAERLKIHRSEVGRQQALLDAWNNLFRDGKLSWGYDLDNPGRPFFHFPEVEAISATA